MRLAGLVNALVENGQFGAVTTSIRNQFGDASRPYIGPSLLPERTLPSESNIVEVRTLMFRSVIALDMARYSPPPKRSSAVSERYYQHTATSGTKVDVTVEDTDLLTRLRGDNLSLADAPRVFDLMNKHVIIPMVENVERHRWEALVGAQVTLRGDNKYREVVGYTNPSGSRVAIAGGAWAGPTYDAVADYMARIEWLRGNGFSPARSITTTPMLKKFLANPAVRALMGDIILNGNSLTVASALATQNRLNDYFGANNLPPIELYDLQYRNINGTSRFLQADAWVITGTTPQSESIDLGDNATEMLPNTLGYVAVGTVAGQGAPGRYSSLKIETAYPPSAWAEGVQETLPIIQQPLGVTVMTGA